MTKLFYPNEIVCISITNLFFYLFSYNRISDVSNSDLKNLLNLQELRLVANNIIDLQKAALRPLTGLQSLDLSRNRIEVLQFGQFAGLSGLRIVNLSHNRYVCSVYM